MLNHDRQNDDEIQKWWEETWRQRELLLRKEFGITEPPDSVTSFSWEDPDLIIPGGCALTFPPNGNRKHWIYLSHGLTQPLWPDPEPNPAKQSGYGWEFALLTASKSEWALDVLYELLTYLKETNNPIYPGDRVPMVFYVQKGDIQPILRDLQSNDPYPPFGEMRALLFWPYLDHTVRLKTSTGPFGILVGTAITGREWELAKTTSTFHVLLLLLKSGIGQLSDIDRGLYGETKQYRIQWDTIVSLPQVDVEQILMTEYAVAKNSGPAED